MIFNEPALSHTYQLLRDGAFITMQNIISLNIVHVVFKFNVIIIFKDEIKMKCFNLKKKKKKDTNVFLFIINAWLCNILRFILLTFIFVFKI